ncbi:hypothetical protein JXR93_09835 [bacterium]|nr:hypothetical protein [bacterium]
MKKLFISMILFSSLLFAETAADVYKEALNLQEVDGNFQKAKQLYQKIITSYVQEPEFVARAMYQIAFISEMYGENVTAENYYKVVMSKYSNYTGLKILSARGVYRLTQGKAGETVAKKDESTNVAKTENIANTENIAKVEEIKTVDDPFKNTKYRKGEVSDLHIIHLSNRDTKTISFNSIKGVAVSNPKVVDIKASSSGLELTPLGVGYTEIVVKTADSDKDTVVGVAVINTDTLKVKEHYLVKGDFKRIFLSEIAKVALDNSILKVEAKSDELSITAEKEGNVNLLVEQKNGARVEIPLKIYKPLELSESFSLKLLETKEVAFSDLSSVSVSKQGIVDIKQDGEKIKITATAIGETAIILYGKDGAQAKYLIKTSN